MDVLKFSVILAMAWLFGSCCGDGLVGEDDNSSSASDVVVEFTLTRSESDVKDEALFSLLSEDGGEMEIRIYMFRSKTPEIDESFICVSPYSVEGEDPYIYIPLSGVHPTDIIGSASDSSENGAISYNGALNIDAANGFYYRFMAIGFRLNGQPMIDCAPGTRWNDVKVRDVSENPTGRVGEFFAGVAVADRSTGSIDYQIAGGSLRVDVELRRAVAGLILCVGNVPYELASDFTFYENEGSGLGTEKEMIVKGESYSVDRVSIIAPGFNIGYFPGTYGISQDNRDTITEDYHESVTELVSVDLNDAGNWSTTDVFSSGEFVMPVHLAYKSTENRWLTLNRSSLYLGIYTAIDADPVSVNAAGDGMERSFYPIRVIPVRMSTDVVTADGALPVGPGDDGWISADRFRFNLQANHLYCLGTPGSPIDLSKIIRSENADIEVSGNYQVDVNIPF